MFYGGARDFIDKCIFLRIIISSLKHKCDTELFSLFLSLDQNLMKPKKRGLEFSSYKIELWNRVTQNDVTLRVTSSKIFIEILLSSY